MTDRTSIVISPEVRNRLRDIKGVERTYEETLMEMCDVYENHQ